jgi:hypothetical protein
MTLGTEQAPGNRAKQKWLVELPVDLCDAAGAVRRGACALAVSNLTEHDHATIE